MKNLPEKIYLNFGEITKEEFEADDYNEFCKIDEYAVTYCEDMVYDTDVEYVRKDVFIEKSHNFFRQSHYLFHLDGIDLYNFIEDFKKYMEE